MNNDIIFLSPDIYFYVFYRFMRLILIKLLKFIFENIFLAFSLLVGGFVYFKVLLLFK